MPRFSEKEKIIIKERLLAEGEKLFCKYGVQKVTIDELVDAVKIAKASFYKFYEGKEYLYLDIVQKNQEEIFARLEALLKENKTMPSRERVKQLFARMYELMLQYPLLTAMDENVLDIVARKVSSDRLAQLSFQRFRVVEKMRENGIEFLVEEETVSLSFEALYHAWMSLQHADSKEQARVIDIMLQGVIDQVVAK